MRSLFGCGYLFGVPTGGGSPIMFAALQDVSVEFSQDVKSLYGSQKFPIEIAGGKAKIECKASVGRIDPVLFNTIYWGGTLSTSTLTLGSMDEIGTVPGSVAYTVTVANAAQFRTNLGVFDPVTGMFMTMIPSGTPTTGQYTVSAGVYTFAAADANKVLRFYYTYGATTGGSSVVVTNQQLGQINDFRAVLQNSFKGKQTVLELYRCTSTKLSMPFKQDDFLIPSFDFSAQDDGTGNVFAYSAQNG